VSPSRTFILRPVATSLLMVGILLCGRGRLQAVAGIGASRSGLPHHSGGDLLPRRQSGRDGLVGYGALERQFGQVPGLQQMTSTSSDGSSVITLQFNLNLNIDVAEQEVQQSINASGTFLPPTFRRPRFTARPTPPTRPF